MILKDDGCCTNEEKCSLYGDRDDFSKHFPTVTCSKISSSSTASPMTTKNIQITTAKSVRVQNSKFKKEKLKLLKFLILNSI